MLVQLTLKNFKLFKEETLLDCIPGPINEHKASLIRDPLDGEQFLPVISVYGPNGGGKSTVLFGLTYLRSLITSPSPQRAASSRLCYCMDPACAVQPTEFDVLYRHRGFLFRYQLHMLDGMIREENLFYGCLGKDDAGILFNRKESVFHLGRTVSSAPIKQLPADRPLLALLAQTSQSESVQAAFSWFKEMHFLAPSGAELPELPEDQEEKSALCSLLQALDLDISGYRTVPAAKSTGEAGNRPRLLITHTPPSRTGYELAYEEESDGTRKLLSILPTILDSLRHGNLVVADDLDSLLHPHLLRYITGLFTNRERNPHGSQLIFTSHNTAILMPAVLRRDEIWLCSRPAGEDAQLYPLSWYKKENGLIPRNDEAYGKQYLEGRYGASPKVSF